MRNRSLRFLDDSWGKRCEGANSLLWPSIETCTCGKESRAQRSFMVLFGRMVHSRSWWHSLRRRSFFFFLRIDTSLLRAGPESSIGVVRFRRRLEPLVDPVFNRKEPRGVISCGECYMVMEVRRRLARKHAAASMLCGHFRDAGAFPWHLHVHQ